MDKKFEKKKSTIHGFGIFAKTKIKKGESFYKIPKENIFSNPRPSWARVGDIYVCDEEVLNLVNHCCEPNTKINQKTFSLVSLKNIESGEEITCDYNKTEKDGTKTPCNCQTKTCRGYFLREI